MLLECIDPQRGRFEGWLNVGNFLKFSCEFDTASDRMMMYDEWSKGEWLYKKRVPNYDADRMPKVKWNGTTSISPASAIVSEVSRMSDSNEGRRGSITRGSAGLTL